MSPSWSPDDGNFYVSISGVVAERVRRLQRRAASQNRGAEFITAFRAICDRLRNNPIELGEEINDWQAAHLQLRLVVIRPACVEFAIHETEPIVFIRDVKLLGLPS